MTQEELERVQTLAMKIRKDVLEMLLKFGSGHLGGSMSIADLMAVLYGKDLAYDPNNPRWQGRDRVVLSKGHAGPAWYSALAESGFFPTSELFTLNQPHTNLPSHPDRLKTPGVDMTTGSLGQGCSTAAGIATALKMEGSDSWTYLICGDGELNEGQCWEAFMYIAAKQLDHLIVFIDDNKKQLDGYTADVLNPFDYVAKMSAFGFKSWKIDGQDVTAIDDAIQTAKAAGTPCAIVLDTTKGAGVPYFEQLMDNHSVKFNNPEAITAAEDAIAGFTKKIEGSEA